MSEEPDEDLSSTKEEDGAILYRGVHDEHLGFAEALQGIVRPQGGHTDPILHNAHDTKSEYTSWTTNRAIAVEGAADQNGVVLEKWLPKSEWVRTPDIQAEDEILIRGLITGAKVTKP